MNDAVSRETPPAPSAATGVFSHALPKAERYADLLATEGVLRGLIGPREVPRLWERHLLNCAVLADALPEGADVCDIGSGAGLPGLVLAIRRPDLQLSLVEPLLRRTTFLSEAIEELGLSNVEVVRGRAEELHGRRDFQVVTSRAVAPLERLLGWSMPLVRKQGALVAMKGSSVRDEIASAGSAVRRWTDATAEVLSYGDDLLDPPTTVLRLEATRPSELGLGARTASPDPESGRSAKSRKSGARGPARSDRRSGR